MKNFLKFILGFSLSIILLYIVFRKVEIREIIYNLQNTKIFYILISLVLGVFLLFLRSIRIRMFIEEYRNFKVINFFEALNIGLFFNNILPFRIGDYVQGYVIAKKTNLPKSLTFSTVLMERFIDLFPPIIFIIVGSFFIILPKQISLFVSIIVLLFLFLFLILFFKFQNFILDMFKKISKKHKLYDKIYKILENLYRAFNNFKKVSLLINIMFLTFLLWSGYSFGMVLICKALDVNLPSFWAGYLIQAITALSVIIPSSPGYVGSWEFMGSLALSIFKIEKTKSLSFALLSHFLGMIPVVTIGSFFVIKEVSLMKGFKKEEFYETKEIL